MKTVMLWIILVLVNYAYAEVIPIPNDKKEIIIQKVTGEKGSVTFSHEKHATAYKDDTGQKMSCIKCHHTQTTSDNVMYACDKCHVTEGTPQKEFNGKQSPFLAVLSDNTYKQNNVLYHKLCLDCHKKVKVNSEGNKITNCKTCHPK